VSRGECVERYVRFIVRHRVAVVLAVLLVTAALATQLRHVHLEIRRRAQLPESHPYVQVQNRIADIFGGETTVILGVIARQGDIFRPEILGKVLRITRAIENLPGVIRSNVLSIAGEHVKTIRGNADGLDVQPLLNEVPEDPEGLARLKTKVLGDPIFAGTLVARQGGAAAIVADFDDRLTDVQIRQAIEKVIGPERDELVDIAAGGAPLVRASMADYTRAMLVLFPLAVLVIGVVHYEAFHSLQAMFLPLLTALLSVVWALGLMGALGEPMDTWSALTPVVILAVAAGHAVQILKRYYEEYAACGETHEAIVRSVTSVGPVMLTAGIIAAASFGSLMTFGVTSVRVFGWLLALGILSALTIEMTFIPACRAMLWPPSSGETLRQRRGRFSTLFLEWISQQVVQRPVRVAVVVLSVVAGAVVGMARLHVDNSFRSWFPADSVLRRDDAVLNDRLAGTSTLYILLEGQAPGDLEDPEALRAISDLQSWLARDPRVGATLSLADFVKQMHRAMSGDSHGGEIPNNKQLIAQYLFLYSLSGPNDFNSVVDPAHRMGVLRAYVRSDEAVFGTELFRQLNAFATERFKNLRVQPRIAGGALAVQTALNEVIVREKLLNVAQIAVLIFILSAVALRSLAAGALVLLPLTLAVLVTLGVMGWTTTWLSIGTATFTAMAVGIGADFAIYLLFRIREEIGANGGDLAAAIQVSLKTSGEGILYVSSAVVSGYLVMTLSGFKLWIHLGLLTSLMMAVSALAALTILPVAVLLTSPRFLLKRAGAGAPVATPAQAHAGSGASS